MSGLAWIDFDQADRDRTRRIIDLFDEKDTRDELGLGALRDALSDLMFPGTSTIQTRLRYMLFVPWIYWIAAEDRQPVDRARALIARNDTSALKEQIDALARTQRMFKGVVGKSA